MDTQRAREAVSRWARQGEAFSPPSWGELPSIPLYMDQVILYLGESLELLQREEGESLLTSSMINNYVKHGLLPHPEKKKYGKAHLGTLEAICAVKQVLSIQDAGALFGQEPMGEGTYELFREAYQASVRETCRKLREDCAQGEDLKKAALLLAVEAVAKQAAAERILQELGREGPKKGKGEQP